MVYQMVELFKMHNMKLYIKDGVIKSASEIELIKDGKRIINPKNEMLLASGWEEYIAESKEDSSEENFLDKYKRDVIQDILNYDSSSNINEFSIQDIPVWLDKPTRVGLKLRFESELEYEMSETTLWYNNRQFTLNLQDAMQMLHAIEIYASKCYDNTQKHIANVSGMFDIEDVLSYDYKSGYPEKLNF